MCILNINDSLVVVAFTGKTKPLVWAGVLPKDMPKLKVIVSKKEKMLALDDFEGRFPEFENEHGMIHSRPPRSIGYDWKEIRIRGGSYHNAGRKPKRHVKFLRHAT